MLLINIFRETTIAAYVLSLIGMIAFTCTLAKGKYIIYVIAVIVGYVFLLFFQNKITLLSKDEK